MNRTILTALMTMLLWSAGFAHAAAPVYSLGYTGSGKWIVQGIGPSVGPDCAMPNHDRTIAVETGPASHPLLKNVIVPIFFPEPGNACQAAYPWQYQPPFSFVAVMAPSKGVPGVLNLGILQFTVSEDGVSIERTVSDITGNREPTFTFYPWDFRFAPQAYDRPGVVVLVGTVQKDGKLRVDVRDGARGAWIATVIDGGWPIWNPQDKTYKPATPNMWQPIDARRFPSTLSYFAIYKEPLMETKRWDGQGPPTVNYMSNDLYTLFRGWSLVDRDNAAPQNRYLPCNTGHWLPERAPKKKVGPVPPGVRLCKVAP